MKKFLPYMGAAIATLAMTWSVKANADDMFKDVPSDHWAYQAISDLQQKKILLGYPNGYFQGKRVLTRYEFAVALKRALDAIGPSGKGEKGDPGTKGDAGVPGDKGEKGDIGPPGMTPEQVTELMRLTDTFKSELATLGADVSKINARLDALTKSVASLADTIDKMVKVHGEFFQGFRSDLARSPFLDYSGAGRGAAKSPFSSVDSPSDFHLLVNANLAGGVKFIGDMVASTYLNYAGLGIAGGGGALGGKAVGNGGPMQFNLYQAELMIPISQFGSKTTLELGRFKNQLTPLTYMRPDTDAYFNLPWYDDGMYVQDGFKLSSKFGSATTQLFAGSYTNLNSSTGGPLNVVPVGTSIPLGGGTAFGLSGATQSVGLHIGIPIARIGELGLTLLDFSNGGGGGLGASTNEVVYGANFNLKPMGRIHISGELSKSVTQKDFNHADGSSNDDNSAYNVHASYASGPLGVLAGYQYIDPRFSAPGYWDKVGSIYNPVNVQGPYLRLNYKFTDKLNANLGGEYLEGARNRNFGGLVGFGLPSQGSSIGKIEAGVKYNLNKTVHLGADYEGDFLSLSAAGSRFHAWQQFITLSAGVNLTGNTVLKFGYQMLGNQDLSGIAPGLYGGGAAGGLAFDNANVFTTSVTVHF